jgi:hypothetical protein
MPLAGDVEDYDPDQEGLVLLGGGWGMKLTILTSLKIVIEIPNN